MRLCRGMPVCKNDVDDDWGWDTIPFIVDGTVLLSVYFIVFLVEVTSWIKSLS